MLVPEGIRNGEPLESPNVAPSRPVTPQPAASTASIPRPAAYPARLSDLIEAHSGGDQGRIVGPAPKVSHMSPALDDDPAGPDQLLPAARKPRVALKRLMVVRGIGAQKPLH